MKRGRRGWIWALLACMLCGAAQATEPATPSPNEQLAVLVAVVMFFGGLGGFVDGMTTDINYKVTFGARSFDIGSLGDFLVGATAGIAIFTVGSALFPNMPINEFGKAVEPSIRIIAVSVLSGYAGVRLLNPLTRKMVEQISEQKAAQAAQGAKTRSDELVMAIKDGEKKLSRYDTDKGRLAKDEFLKTARGLIDEAKACFDVALGIDPQDTEALIGQAKVARRRAELCQATQQDDSKDWAEATALLDQVIARHPDSARAHYNKACYLERQRSPAAPPTAALAALKLAIALQLELKARARKDPDFERLVDKQPDFDALTRG